jgi:hypothetical protein
VFDYVGVVLAGALLLAVACALFGDDKRAKRGLAVLHALRGRSPKSERQGRRMTGPRQVGRPRQCPDEVRDVVIELRREGLSLRQIARRMNAAGYRTPSGKVTWSHKTVDGLLATRHVAELTCARELTEVGLTERKRAVLWAAAEGEPAPPCSGQLKGVQRIRCD